MPYPSNTSIVFTAAEFTGLFNSRYRDGSQPNLDPYPTIGIPSPTWGVQDVRPGRPDPWTVEEPGFYYINYATGSDASTYGTPLAPRKTLPYPIQEGSYVETAGTYSHLIANDMRVWGQGTKAAPIWIVGATGTNPEFNAGGQKTLVFGSYIYIQEIKFDGTTSGPAVQVSSVSDDFFASDHIMIDSTEITGTVTTSGGVSVVNTPGTVTNNVIVVDNEIHTIGPQVDADFDAHMINLGDGVTDVWGLGNTLRDTSGSGVQIGTAATAVDCERIYMGQNHVYNTRQSGIWVKAGKDVIISQNNVHDVKDRCVGADTSPSKGLGGQFRMSNVWWLFNDVSNVRYGIRAASTTTNKGKSIYAVGNNISTIDGSYGGGACFPNDPDGTNPWDDASIHFQGCDDRWIIDNTLYSLVSGIHTSNVGVAATTITGNIVSQISGTNGRNYFSERTDGSITAMQNNLWFNASFDMKWGGNDYTSLAAYQVGTGFGQDDLTGDPLFADEASKDFTIPLASPAAGANFKSPVYDIFEALYGRSIDFDKAGTARPTTGRSIGAYEAV